MIRIVASLFLTLCLASPGRAASISGESLPDTYMLAGQPLVLNGIGLRTLTIFRVKVYVGGLYVTQRSHDARAILASPGPKVMLLRFVHAATKAEVEKQYRTGEENNCGNGGCAPSDAADFERLVAAAPAVGVGDTSTFIFTRKGVRVLANDRVIGDFANPDLSLRLLAGFIGDKPPSEDLRAHLLGLATD